MKLLNIDANAKTVKGQAKGYMTAVLYLAPYKVSGVNVCPMAEKAGCWRTCLNTAGRGGMPVGGTFTSPGGIELPDNAIQRARIRRTRLWTSSKQEFLQLLHHEIELHLRGAARKKLTPTIRLNGTSDIQWERVLLEDGRTFFEHFPDVQFYDYTKIAKRLYDETRPENYYLCLSGSAADWRYKARCLQAEKDGKSVVWVVRDEAAKQQWLHSSALTGLIMTVDGDEHDLRFLDPPGARVVLRAKGSAKKETNGFVLN
jgi:hypothetical protein